MDRTNNILTASGFTVADLTSYSQSMADDYASAHNLGDDWTDSDIDYTACDDVSLDRLGDYVYNHNIADLRGYLETYCGRCTTKQAMNVIHELKRLNGDE